MNQEKLWAIPQEVAGDYPKCGCCNWRVGKVYLLAPTLEKAIELFHENDRGLCGDCMSEMIVEQSLRVMR